MEHVCEKACVRKLALLCVCEKERPPYNKLVRERARPVVCVRDREFGEKET